MNQIAHPHEFQLSILLPSAHPLKRERFIANLRETLSDFNSVEIVICLDGNYETFREANFVNTYSPPSKARGSFFNAAWKASTGRFLLMANDDILFKTKNWDKLIPYDKYPDDIALFYFKDNQFNEHFSCHPIWSRKVMNIDNSLFSPPYQITKCDNTIWDIHPPHRRIYIPEIEIEHIQTPYGPEWKTAYDEDNSLYIERTNQRNAVRAKILNELGVNNSKVMIGVPTSEYARRADFYDHLDLIDRPPNSINLKIHSQSIAFNRNKIVEAALIHNCTHVLFIDDDVICRPNIIYNLLERNKDIVTGLQLKRNFPHFPLIEIDKKDAQLGQFNSGLIRINAAGLGCVLINTEVFKIMEKPWFRLGELEKDQLQEDTSFYRRAEEAGFEIYCDLDSPVGHIGSVIIRPVKANDMWTVDYDTSGRGSIAFVPPNYENLNGIN